LITEVRNLAASFPRLKGLGIPLSKVGFPIRKSTDQSFFAAPRGLSQRSTSFIASQRQGIHRMPLRHLIALIINAHPLGVGSLRTWSFDLRVHAERTLIQKDQLASRSCQRCLRSGSHRHCCECPNDFSFVHTWSRSPLHDVRQHARLVDRRSVRNLFSRANRNPRCSTQRSGGARRDRTDDILLAKQALSQLS
jgi:hypothetical protein